VKNRALRLLSQAVPMVLLLLALGLILPGCSADFNLSCGDAETAAKTYTDADYGYSFQYPGGWVVQQGDSAKVTGGSSSDGGMSVYDPEGTVAGDYFIDLFQVSVYELAVTVDESMMPEIKSEVETLLADLETQGNDWTKVEDLSGATVDGMDGYQATYGFTTDGTPTMSTFYFLFTGDIQYQLTLQAATETWEERRPEFDAIVASFTPGDR
jgi:hypothetical protein